MWRDEKRINFAIAILRSVIVRGARSLSEIHEYTMGSRSYNDKIVAKLRNAGIIDSDYETKPADKIMIADVIRATVDIQSAWAITGSISKIVMKSLEEVSIKEVW